MKLYYAAGTCALSPHIVLEETGLAHTLVKVDLRTKRTAAGDDYTLINPKGYVPALELDDGSVLTEGPAIVQYLADRAPESGLAPANGSLDRYRLQEWLNYVSTELHKQFSPLFSPTTPDETKAAQRDRIAERCAWIDGQLAQRDYLTGKFSVADAYLFTVLSWARLTGIDLTRWSKLAAYVDRIGSRKSVKAAMRAEGLIT